VLRSLFLIALMEVRSRRHSSGGGYRGDRAAGHAGKLEFLCRRAGSVQPVEAPDAVAIHGFDQARNIREYMFDGLAAGETAKHFV